MPFPPPSGWEAYKVSLPQVDVESETFTVRLNGCALEQSLHLTHPLHFKRFDFLPELSLLAVDVLFPSMHFLGRAGRLQSSISPSIGCVNDHPGLQAGSSITWG